MSRVKELLTRYKKFLPVVATLFMYGVIISLYALAFFYFETPFKRMNYDTFTQIGLMKTWVNEGEGIQFFPGLFQLDLRTRFYYKFWVLIHQITGLDFVNILFINGVINISLLFAGFFYFLKTLKIEWRVQILSFIILFFMLGNLWVLNDPGFTIVTIGDLTINAFYPQILGFGLMLFILALCIRYLKQDKLVTWGYGLILLLFTIVFLLHLFTGLITVILMGILLFSEYLKNKKINKKMIVLAAGFGIILLGTLLFKEYNWLNYVIRNTVNLQNSPIGLGTADPKYYSVQARIAILGLTILGLPVLFMKQKNSFLKWWVFFFVIASISYLFPFKVPYFWRFINFVRIPLSIFFAMTIVQFQATYRRFIIVLIVVFGVISSFNVYARNAKLYDDTVFIEFINEYENKIILADEIESNYIQGYTNNQTVTIANGHITSPDVLQVNLLRLDKLSPIYEGSSKALDEAIKEHGVELFLVNKYSTTYDPKILLTIVNYQIIYENEKYVLYKVK